MPIFNYCAGLFYYILGNIDPKFRSRVEVIQLVTVVKSTLITKYGIDEILKHFIRDINELEKVLCTYCMLYI